MFTIRRNSYLTRRSVPRLFAFIGILVFLYTFYNWCRDFQHGPEPTKTSSKALVVASLKGDDTRWLHEYFRDWDINIFIMNDPTAKLTVAKNKGRESTAYLTYGHTEP